MEVIVVFVLLCLFVNNGYGTPQMNYILRNQTWNEASNDSTCSMIGLNLTGKMEENIDNISSSIAWDKQQTAWIGAYAKRVWINFEGCYYGRFKSNDSWLTITSQGDPAKTCLDHCNDSRFVLTEDKCVCYKDVKDVFQTGCLAGKCSDSNYTYCGKGTAVNTRNIVFHCMCRFSTDNDSSDLYGEGNCLTVTYKPTQHAMAMNCGHTYRPICYDTNTKQIDISGSSNNWLESLSECYQSNTQFAGRTTNVTGILNDTYWVGMFAVTFKSWGRAHSENDSCVAVNIDRNNNLLTTVVLPCDTLLPALCMNTSISNNYSEFTTECPSSCNHPSATYPQQFSNVQDTSTSVLSSLVTRINELVTSPVSQLSSTNRTDGSDDQTNMLTKGRHKSPVPLIVGSVVGGVVGVALFVAVVSFLCHRRAFRKRSTETDISLSNVEDRMLSSINYRDTTADTINAGENVYGNNVICNTNGAETPEGGGYTEPHSYVRQENTVSGVYINADTMYQPELFAQQNPESHYCDLSLPSHDEHEYGQLK